MKRIARKILFFGSLSVWALIAIGSGHSHSHKCNEEWKLIPKVAPVEASLIEKNSIDKDPGETSHTDMHFPGFMNLLFQ
jgi:hypothetical protein